MPSVSSTPSKLTNPTSAASNHHSHSPLCRHSPSATLDLLILIVVLFSGTFLLSSYFSYLFHSLSLLLSLSSPHLPTLSFSLSLPYLLAFFAFFILLLLLLLDFCCGPRSRRCNRPGCKGLKKALEFDLQLQTEDSIRSAKDIDALPWKGGSESNPDYECLRAELRKMAPPNGRAVLLFRSRCGCPVYKLEGWGPKRGRRQKRALNGGSDHR
ncbi:hypothetical protein HS088_TW13G01509 [Tripterygium wilfordii]|uniref:Ribosomal protein L34e superfamily protein n=1 Tax=Tripterygium wilfordii TaxID=458696 RepID=A0A7J7CX80_TRIWF|nr:uncharacterized protein At5g19025-like [Tripterygium wilfordii]KAF5738608.1 hypothetical protein HS088_TW13G01509 [Tripterygium wilfordii]